VIAAHPAERLTQLRRIERAHLAARRAQRRPETVARLPLAAQPVVHHRHEYTAFGTCHQGIAKGAADIVVADDVVLQQHAFPGTSNGVKPGLVMRGGVDQ